MRLDRHNFKEVTVRLPERGFTLVEMLVVVAILSILAVVGVTIMNIVIKDARDQQRVRDLNSVKQALEMYRNDAHYYPSSVAFACPASGSLQYNSKTYLDQLPNDPLCSKGRTYAYRALPQGFVLCALKQGNGFYGSVTECGNLDCMGTTKCNIEVSSD